MRAAEQYFPVGHCIYYSVQVVVTFESGDEILKCEHSNTSYCACMYYFSVPVLFVMLYKLRWLLNF